MPPRVLASGPKPCGGNNVNTETPVLAMKISAIIIKIKKEKYITKCGL